MLSLIFSDSVLDIPRGAVQLKLPYTADRRTDEPQTGRLYR